MSITRYCLKNPSGVLVIVAIISVLGLYSLSSLPIQLFPDIERPWLGVNTSWRATAPQEVESEIIEPLEDVLRGLPGLEQMRSTARPGNGNIGLQFGLNTDMQEMMIEVISRLNRLSPLPADADLPSIFKGDMGGGNNTLAWFFIQLLPGNSKSIDDYGDYVTNTIAPEIETVPGVASVNYGWTEPGQKEIQITLDPYRAAEYGITITDITRQIGRSNDISGGRAEVGRREYTLRYKGKYTPEQLNQMILEWRGGTPIKLGDIATVNIGLSRDRQLIYQNGNPAIGVQVLREPNANVFSTLTAVKKTVEALSNGPLKEQGLTMAISFDPTVFIKRAIGLLINNLIIGLILASLVLWWFLRQSRATLLITLTVPISLFTTFVVLKLTGRSLNVISLAGLAFAVGMVMDAAIVVLENIIRHREKGKQSDDASTLGTKQVWNALLASTITTVAIFIPVLFMKDVAGQLFSDLALTIAVGVSVSLVVAVTILPTMSRYWMKHLPVNASSKKSKLSMIPDAIMRLTNSKRRRNTWIVALLSTPVFLTYLLMPNLDYLPPVKRDAVDAFFSTSPGASTSFINEEVIKVIVDRLKPYMAGEKEPALKNYYVMTWDSGGTIGARVKDQARVKELEQVVRQEILINLPGVNSFARQGNLFGGFGNDGDIQLHLQSSNQAALLEAARKAITIVKEALPNASVNPPAIPGLAGPELQFIPKEERIMESGWNRADMGSIIRTLGEGMWLGEHFDGDRRLDMILRVSPWDTPETLANTPLATPAGHILPLSELVEIKRRVGPTQIQRIDGRRTITLNIGPGEGVSLQEILHTLKHEVEPKLLPLLPEDGSLKYAGSADDLDSAISSMSKNFLFALGLLCLLLAGLFKSLRDAIVVTISIPLAIVGGIIALTVLNWITFQPLDLLTMIGFIILLGLVVNNAILLVHQTRQAEETGSSRREAVGEALKIRIRPILMSTLSSLFGMLPLLLFPGEGSAIYRGLAAAIVGGMTISTLFTLILLPSLLQLGEPRLFKNLQINKLIYLASNKFKSQEG